MNSIGNIRVSGITSGKDYTWFNRLYIYTYRISKNITRPCYQDQLLQNNTINNGKKCCIAEKRGDSSFAHLFIKKEAQNTMNVHSCNIKQTEQEDGIVDRYR